MPSLNYSENEVAIVQAAGKDIPLEMKRRITGWQRVLDKHPTLFWIGDTGVRRKPRALWEKYAKLTTAMKKRRRDRSRSSRPKGYKPAKPGVMRSWKSKTRRATHRLGGGNHSAGSGGLGGEFHPLGGGGEGSTGGLSVEGMAHARQSSEHGHGNGECRPNGLGE